VFISAQVIAKDLVVLMHAVAHTKDSQNGATPLLHE
jgi:hypothetical protein